MKRWIFYFTWMILSILGAAAFGVLALRRGETISAGWLLLASLCTYTVGYRFYCRFIARKILNLSYCQKTPSVLLNDGRDFVPTNKWILFGHHFAAIAGAGPLVGPVLAAQMGYLPGTIWIIVGVLLGGAVQDMVILVGSMRQKGKSLGEMARQELGRVGGLVTLVAILSITIILLAVLALVVVKALAQSPWGIFTFLMTIPIALFMGLYLRFIRPGRVLEMSLIGFLFLLLALIYGEYISNHPTLASWFTLDAPTITWLLIIYGFLASVIPVWLLLTPRDYLSTFLKIGTICSLAFGIIFTLPELKMPPLTQFVDGSGPVFAGSLFPFIFITIACGAISGFHALVSSGTTPKLIARETHAPLIGYGAMLTESFVAIMALISACVLTPGLYLALNSPASIIGTDIFIAAKTISSYGSTFTIHPSDLTQVAESIGEKTILSRTGGAPTLAIGMATIFSNIIGGKAFMSFWYHFAILFEAVFILTTIDAGTRVGRFILQDLMGKFSRRWGDTRWYPANILASLLVVMGWGSFLYQGVSDPLGGINTLWPLFGIANQMLAVIALIIGTTILIGKGKTIYSWVTLIPLVWLTVTTMTAGWQKLFHKDPFIGFQAAAHKYQKAIEFNQIISPAKTIDDMKQIIFNNNVDALLTAIFIILVFIILLNAVTVWIKLIRGSSKIYFRS